jgi:hypothetical protein
MFVHRDIRRSYEFPPGWSFWLFPRRLPWLYKWSLWINREWCRLCSATFLEWGCDSSRGAVLRVGVSIATNFGFRKMMLHFGSSLRPHKHDVFRRTFHVTLARPSRFSELLHRR